MPNNRAIDFVLFFGFLGAASPAFAGSSYKVLFSFCVHNNCSNGMHADTGVIFDADGNLYGTTGGGGQLGYGEIFELTPAGGTWKETVLYSFTNKDDGEGPTGDLAMDNSGNLYGTTHSGGGASFCGTVFELIHYNGKWSQKTLHRFKCDKTDGNLPSGVILDANGNLYGTTWLGGTYQHGAVFELIPNGSSWTERVIHNFNGRNGAVPTGLVLDSAGNLYGTTSEGGSSGCYHNGCGVVYELTPNNSKWTEKVLHIFEPEGKTGLGPLAGLIFDKGGNLYATTSGGGTYHRGTVFELTRNHGKWTEKLLYSFKGDRDGQDPTASLSFDAAGNLYSTTTAGGLHNYYLPEGAGTVFELSPGTNGSWTERILYRFLPSGFHGTTPQADLHLDATGNLYGTTAFGGKGGGVVFEITHSVH
jgi:uncharacterized repeat protein (TIGR03803 family)